MKNKIFVLIMAASLLLCSLSFFLVPDKTFSEAERRLLAEFPEISPKSIFNGSFMDDFESYAQDHIPLRDSLRGLKSAFSLKILRQGDNNGLYSFSGHIAKIDGPINEKMLDHAAAKFEAIYEKYLENTQCRLYFSMIPDKNRYLAPGCSRPYLDFEELESYMLEKTQYMQYIPIDCHLSLNDYYYSDSHWRQERIEPVAQAICHAMGAEPLGEHEWLSVNQDFRGVYAGQLAAKSIKDRIFYAENETIRACRVTSYDSGMAESVPFYDMEAALGRDPYEMFLNGADALLVIDKPSAKSGRELVIFRDSFTSSLAPLLIESYDKITLVDIRYMLSESIGDFIDFEAQDVLFIYSSGLLNNSLALK